MNQEIIQKLKAPFPFEEVEAKVQVTTQDKAKGMVVFYLTARAIQDRLDDVIGPLNWKNSFTDWKNGQGQLCSIAIYDSERKEWVSKSDGAEMSDIEPIKGGISDAFKRAAVLWGIGRYLYQIDGVWCEVEQRGKGTYIKDNQQNFVKAAYDRAVAHIFGTISQSNAPENPAQSPVTQPPQKENKVQQTPSTASKTQQTSPPAQQTATLPNDEPVYQIKAVKPSGTSSQVLELLDNQGEKLTVYVKAGDAAIKPGVSLRNIQMEKRKSDYGEFNIVSAYQVAA